MRTRCQLARQAIAAGARHASACEACAFFATIVPQGNCPCGHQTSCEHELGRAVATGTPFLGRFALVEPGYRDSTWRARDLETGADVVIGRDGPGQRTRCGALVVARASTQSDSGSMADGAEGDDVDIRLREFVSANAIADAVVLMQERWGSDLERVVRGRRPARLRVGTEDICQMVWTSVYAALPAFRFEAPARAWLFRIARNKINDLVRRDRGDEPLDTDEMAAVAASLTGPLSRLLRDERAAAVQEVLAHCDPADVELLQLHHVFEMSLREIAYFLADDDDPPIAENTLAQRIARLRVRLGKQLKKNELFRSKVVK